MTEDQLAEAEALLRDPDSEDCERFASRYGADLIATVRQLQQPSSSEAQPSGTEPRPYPFASPGLKYSEAFVFEGGSLTVNTTGYGAANGVGWLCFLEKELEWEQGDNGQDYRIANLNRSELIALRDKLNEVFPALTFTASLSDASEVDELKARLAHVEALGRAGSYKATPEHSWQEWADEWRREALASEDKLKEIKALARQFSPVMSTDEAHSFGDALHKLLSPSSGDE